MSRVRIALDLAILFAAAACYLREGFAGMFEALAAGSVVLAAVEMVAASAVAARQSS